MTDSIMNETGSKTEKTGKVQKDTTHTVKSKRDKVKENINRKCTAKRVGWRIIIIKLGKI